MNSFKVGDRVKVRSAVGNLALKNQYGTIIFIEKGLSPIFKWMCIEFDNNIGGNNGNVTYFKGKEEHCWWCHSDLSDIIIFEKKVIKPFGIAVFLNKINKGER